MCVCEIILFLSFFLCVRAKHALESSQLKKGMFSKPI